MRFVTYDLGKAPRAALAVGGMIVDLEKAARALGGERLPASVRETLELGAKGERVARKVARQAERLVKRIAQGSERRPAWAVPEDRVHLGPPVPDPRKIICLGLNYADHCREQEGRFGRPVEPPPHPIIFAKFPNALTGPYDPIRLPAAKITAQVDYEVEMVLVVGRRVQGVSQKDAMGAVAGYMVMNDVSARDVQFADRQWVRAKTFDSFAPCGPWLVTPDEVADPHRLKVWTSVNGVTVQSSSTREMIFRLPRIVSFLAEAITLEPGDLISTGTPAGVGVFRQPPVLLTPGDTVECGIEGIGTICNTCECA